MSDLNIFIILLNAAYLIWLTAFVAKDILWLRILTVTGNLIVIPYYLYHFEDRRVRGFGERGELRRHLVPGIKRRLQGRRDVCRVGAAGQRPVDEDELAVPVAVAKGCEFHVCALSPSCLRWCRRTASSAAPSSRCSCPAGFRVPPRTGSGAAGNGSRT